MRRRRHRLRHRLPPEVRRERLRLHRLERPARRPKAEEDLQRHPLHDGPPSRRTRSTEVGDDDHRVGVRRPQRRRDRLRPRRHAVRHHRRRHHRLRHQHHRPGPDQAAAPRCCASTWITRPPGKPYSRAEGQPVRRPTGVRAGDVGLRPAQPVADHVRPEDRPHLGRPERPGPVGAGYLVQQGRQLRLERHRGEPPVLPRTARPGRRRSSKPTVEHPHSEARSLTGGVVYHGEKLPGAARRVHLRRLLHRPDLGR